MVRSPTSQPHPQPQQQQSNYQSSFDGHSTDYAHSQADLNAHGYDGRPSMSQDRLIPQYNPAPSPMPMRQLNPGQMMPRAAQQAISFMTNKAGYAPGPVPGGYPPQPNGYYGNGQLTGSVVGGTGGWGVAREQMLKKREKKQVQLRDGNLVLDIPIPRQIIKEGVKSEEMTHMRYTAATVRLAPSRDRSSLIAPP